MAADTRRVAHAERHRKAARFEWAVALLTLSTGLLTVLAATTPYFAIDVTLERAIQGSRAGWSEALAAAVSWIGYPPQSNVLFGLLIVALFAAGLRWEAAGLLVAAAGSAGLWFLIAPIVHRPRPDPQLVQVAASIPYGSFPSGHVLNFSASFGFLAFIAWKSRRWWRVPAVIGCGLVPCAIGLARIYQGEHWPSDVLGGFMFGGLWLLVTTRLYRWAAHRWPRRLR